MMSNSEVMLEAVRQRRETRDRIMLQNLIPILNQLRQTVDTWIDGEFKDLEEEISHVDTFAPRDSASRRIDRFRGELRQIRNDHLPQALKELDQLIDFIEKQKFKSAEEAMELFNTKVSPILSVVFNLGKARERVDGMADMIPMPPPITFQRNNDES
jgi:hypothetical protein